MSDLLRPGVRPILTIGLALALAQQFIGVNTVIYYAPTILQFTGTDAGGAVGRTVFVGITNVVFTIVAVLLIDRVGRRRLLLTGTAICIVSLTTLGLFFAIGWLQDNVGWLALASLMTYIAGFADRPGTRVLADDLRDLPAAPARARGWPPRPWPTGCRTSSSRRRS